MKPKFKIFIKKLSLIFVLFFLLIATYMIVNNKALFSPSTNKNLSSLMIQTKSEKITGKKIQLKVLNGCGEKGVAILYTNFLRSKGYDVIEYSNAKNFDFNQTKLRIHKHDNSSFINEIINILSINPNQIEYDYNNNIFYEMSVIIGKDYKNLNSFEGVSMYYNPF